jgi:hypothetical protein
MTTFGVVTDYEWRGTHKTDRLTIWSGSFMSLYEGEAISLPNGAGYMVYVYQSGSKVRVSCPCPRDDTNYLKVDNAISEALDAHYTKMGYTTVVPA